MADAEIIKWSGHEDVCFYLKANEIRGVKDISISAKLETEDETKDKQKFTKKKNSGSYEISLTAVLNATLGVDVQKVALAMTESARQGLTGYFYMGTQKLMTPQFMATDAKIKNLRTTRTGTWLECEVDFTLKQSSKFDGEIVASSSGSSGGGGGGGGGSGSGSTSTSSKKYIVTSPDGSTRTTVWATSIQSAIKQAGGSNWSGDVRVETGGKTYLMSQNGSGGSSSKNTSTTAKASTTTKTTSAAKQASDTVTKNATTNTTVQKISNAVANVTSTVTNWLKGLITKK